jgi:hypothetical protein
MKNFMLFWLYHLYMITGLFPAYLLPARPRMSLIYAMIAFPALAVLAHGLSAKTLTSTMLYWLLVVTFVRTQYVVPIFLGWATIDLISILLWPVPNWVNWYVCGVYATRNLLSHPDVRK